MALPVQGQSQQSPGVADNSSTPAQAPCGPLPATHHVLWVWWGSWFQSARDLNDAPYRNPSEKGRRVAGVA